MAEIKLTKKQKEVVRLMNDGWVLKTHRYLDLGYWLKKNIYKDVSESTFRGLLDKNIISYAKDEEPAVLVYQLSELGKSIKQ